MTAALTKTGEDLVLVLSRKVGEAVLIGNEVRVVVLQIEGARIKLGVEAPASVSVLRGELWRDIAPFKCPPDSATHNTITAQMP